MALIFVGIFEKRNQMRLYESIMSCVSNLEYLALMSCIAFMQNVRKLIEKFGRSR